MTVNKNIKIDIPSDVSAILDTLKNAGFEAYIVGGCVRDVLAGRVPVDWDITTSAFPEQVKSLFPYTVDTGIQHGTVMILSHGSGYEVTTFRIDGDYKDSRHPEKVTFTRSLEEDLKRRDFTINAFAWDENGLVDLFDGISDLENKVIRCVGDPAHRFGEDALRIMRAVRFSAQLGFTIEEKTREQIRLFADRLVNISMERIRVEWEKTLLSPNPDYVREYYDLGLARYIVKDIYEKCFSRPAGKLLKEIIRIRSDADDPEMYRIIAMAVFFENAADQEADKAFRDLKYDNRTRISVVNMIRHMNDPLEPDRLMIKQALNSMGEAAFREILELKRIRYVMDDNHHEKAVLKQISDIYSDIAACREPWSVKQLAVNGSDLIAAGIPAGKKIGEFLEKILQKVIQSPTLNTKEQLCDPVFLSEVEYECKG